MSTGAFWRTGICMIRKQDGPHRFKGAVNLLKKDGVNALLPSVHPKYDDITETDLSKVPANERIWHKPKISKRKAAVMRKQALRNGTYGTFDTATGIGWDAAWDMDLAKVNTHGTGRYMRLRIPKKTERNRTREDRALKIEQKMEGMDQRMEELQAARHKDKKTPTFEEKYKEMMKVQR